MNRNSHRIKKHANCRTNTSVSKTNIEKSWYILNRRNENILSVGHWPQTWFSSYMRSMFMLHLFHIHKYIHIYGAVHSRLQHFCTTSSNVPHMNTPITFTYYSKLVRQKSPGMANSFSLENKNQNQKPKIVFCVLKQNNWEIANSTIHIYTHLHHCHSQQTKKNRVQNVREMARTR